MAQFTETLGDSSIATPDQLLETLGRLAKKPGVQATIILDRNSGAILTTDGNISLPHTSTVTNTSSAVNPTARGLEDVSDNSGNLGGIEKMAAMVWNFISAAGGLVQGLDAEDELKLLRLRTKKHELVIVPDQKYLLVVVHETPPA